MATYTELWALGSNNDTLIKRVATAAIIKAHSYTAAATPTTAQVAWAKEIFSDPRGKALAILFAVLAANKFASVAQITSATDAQIQTNVDLAVDKIFANPGA